MLKLEGITKNYYVAGEAVPALRGIDIEFRKNEFVSVLGPSGCGKTTLLNIIGGLDRYTDGNLIISGKSTKEFREADWNSYRNHSIGFVFQSYNLIPHQTVLGNVELALTLAGVSKQERRRRAAEALRKVGLGDHLKKLPGQMSGGQMQRVAIARALVNDPEILLADEPTGALDSVTSVQIMELLKEIASDRLVIMVTHNAELAEQYSTRIVRLSDGKVIGDTDPYRPEKPETPGEKFKKIGMAFQTALSLSFRNLMTKKGRTFLTAFAGSIGIIGIALILSLSNGVNEYINSVEEDTLSGYPITIERETMDTTSLLTSLMSAQEEKEDLEDGYIYSGNVMGQMLNIMLSEVQSNDLGAFKAYIESGESGIEKYVSDIRYSYETPLTVYRTDTETPLQVNPSIVMDTMYGGQTSQMMDSFYGSSSAAVSNYMAESTGIFTPLTKNGERMKSQYEVLAGRLPEAVNEVVLIVSRDRTVSDYSLYNLGFKDSGELMGMMRSLMSGEEVDDETVKISYDELLSMKFRVLPQPYRYEKTAAGYEDRSGDPEYIAAALENAVELTVVGIVMPGENAAMQTVAGQIGYSQELMDQLIETINGTEIVKAQLADPDTDVFTGQPFGMGASGEGFDVTALTEEELGALSAMTPEQIAAYEDMMLGGAVSGATYESNLALLGVSDTSKPMRIEIYPNDFESKDEVTRIIAEYNAGLEEGEGLQYTDYIGLLLHSVTTILDAISYVLIAFVSISLVVSSIMIGIITYISVLERKKEIGILRALGASKRDISRVFNAETLIVGFVAGLVGIGCSVGLILIINIIIYNLTGLANLKAILPVEAGAALVLISMLLTFIAGLIPARLAAKKDPVVALRSE